MLKNTIRKKYLKIRSKNKSFTEINFFKLEKLLKKVGIKKNSIIGGYFPIKFEIDSLKLLKNLENNHFKIALPIIGKNFKMDYYEWNFSEILKTNDLGIPEPQKKKKVFPNVLLVPLVAFDKRNYRIGYGGGFYDRYIEKLKDKQIITIGLAYSNQRINKIKINDYDKKLNFVITDKYIQ